MPARPAAPPRPPGTMRGEAPAGAERLQKVLAQAGLASRREVEEWIRAGRLTVNGRTAQLGARVGPQDTVLLDGRKVRLGHTAPAARVFLCHRSPGEPLRAEVPAAPGREGAVPQVAARAALLDRLPGRAGRRFVPVSPMPRIDGGLELVSSEGALAARLQRGVRHIISEFSVRVRGELAGQQRQQILGGLLDNGEQLEVLGCELAGGEGSNRWYTVVVRGGSGKEIRQLFERQGALVSRVLRTRFGPVQLARTVARGHYRELLPEELDALLAAAAGAPPAAAGAAAEPGSP